MAKANNKLTTFHIQARVFLETSIPVAAVSLEAALEHARGLKTTDFIEIRGEHNDSRVEIDGLWSENPGI